MSAGGAGAKPVEIYTDGACRGNPGPGGWGALLIAGDARRELSGYEAQTTNNRMELMAAIEALRALKRPVDVILYTDSKYVCTGIEEWLPNWKRRDWRTADRKPVKNVRWMKPARRTGSSGNGCAATTATQATSMWMRWPMRR